MRPGKHPGRIRIRLAELLLDKGIVVSPYDLWTQEGGYRHMTWDLARWGSYEATFPNGITPDGSTFHGKVHLSSWSTMTDCVRFGIEVFKEDKFGIWNWVCVERAEPPKKGDG